jgi:hypothetical protein
LEDVDNNINRNKDNSPNTPTKEHTLTKEQRQALESRQKYLHDHAGHEKQHAQMALILIISLILFQLILLLWKKFHPSSYALTSLLGLWLIPPLIGMQAGNTRYVVLWALFSFVNVCQTRPLLIWDPLPLLPTISKNQSLKSHSTLTGMGCSKGSLGGAHGRQNASYGV